MFKTHFDIGFTDLAENVIRNYSTQMLDQVLETCEATEHMGSLRYIWTLPAWPLKMMLEHCSPDRKVRLEHLIENDQIVWHALPYTSHFDFCGLDEYRYGFTYARELSQKYGKPFPIAAKMTDVPGHGRMLPSILAGQGVRFLHLGCNEFLKPPKVPELFYWEGPDGKRVLTMYSKGYGSGIQIPADWPYPVWMALMHTHDNSGPQSTEMILKIVEELKKRYPEAQVVCGTMEDFCRELEKENLNEIPVVKKDLADAWIHGVGSYPAEVKIVREVRRRLARQSERYQLVREQLNPEENTRVQKLLGQCSDNLMLFSEHTWGLDTKTWLGAKRSYTPEDFRRERQEERCLKMEASWKEQSDRAWKAQRDSEELERILEPFGDLSVPQRSADTASEENSFRRVGEGIVENTFFRVIFNEKSGDIEQIYNKKLGKIFLEGRHGAAAVFYQYDRYGVEDMTEYLRNVANRFSDWGIKDNGKENYPECAHVAVWPKFDRLEIHDNQLIVYYHNTVDDETYGNAEEIVLRFIFAGEVVGVEAQLKGKSASPYTESGSLVLSLPMDNVKYGINKNGYVLNPKKDIADWANHAMYCAEDFVTAKEDEKKLCVVSLDAPLLGIGETGIYKFRKKYRKKRPQLYFNLFNNMWGTNFPQWIEGDFSWRFLLRDASGSTKRELLDYAKQWIREWEYIF